MNESAAGILLKKLVRDNIPGKVQAEGSQKYPGSEITFHNCSVDEYMDNLFEKLKEEVLELKLAVKDKSNIAEEMADVLEVLSCIRLATGVSSEDIFTVAEEKRKEAGSFVNGTIMVVKDK